MFQSLGNGPCRQRKEVGITAYKKPGPPTPSKQAGRLSATVTFILFRHGMRLCAYLNGNYNYKVYEWT